MQRGETRDFRLKTLGLKFRSDKNLSKWPPEAVAGRKMSSFVRRRAVWRRCCASDPWRAPSSIRSNPFSEGTAATVRNIVWYDRKNIRFAATRLPVEAKR